MKYFNKQDQNSLATSRLETNLAFEEFLQQMIEAGMMVLIVLLDLIQIRLFQQVPRLLFIT